MKDIVLVPSPETDFNPPSSPSKFRQFLRTVLMVGGLVLFSAFMVVGLSQLRKMNLGSQPLLANDKQGSSAGKSSVHVIEALKRIYKLEGQVAALELEDKAQKATNSRLEEKVKKLLNGMKKLQFGPVRKSRLSQFGLQLRMEEGVSHVVVKLNKKFIVFEGDGGNSNFVFLKENLVDGENRLEIIVNKPKKRPKRSFLIAFLMYTSRYGNGTRNLQSLNVSENSFGKTNTRTYVWTFKVSKKN